MYNNSHLLFIQIIYIYYLYKTESAWLKKNCWKLQLFLCQLASKLEPCSKGISLGSTEDCRKTTYTRKVVTNRLAVLSADDVELIARKSGLKAENDSVICFHREYVFSRKYEFLQKNCCDPLGLNPTTARMKSSPCRIDIANADKINSLVEKVSNLVKCCAQNVHRILKASMKVALKKMKGISLKTRMMCMILPLYLAPLVAFPLSLNSHRQTALLTRNKRLKRRKWPCTTYEVGRRLNVGYNEVQTCQKCKDPDPIVDEIKEKCSTLNMEATLKLITLEAPSWTIEKTAKEFGVFTFMVNKAWKLKKTKGI